MRHQRPRLAAELPSKLVAVALATLAAASGCDQRLHAGETGGNRQDTVATTSSALQGLENFAPKPGAYLNGVQMGDALGDGMVEYYQSSSAFLTVHAKDPNTGVVRDLLNEEATQTFDLWKQTFGFSAQETGTKSCTSNGQCGLAGCDTTKKKCKPETIQQWRDRTGVVVYYNSNELGLGRELGCSTFVEFSNFTFPPGPTQGQACFVTNYGALFQSGDRDGREPMLDAIHGVNKKNTVAITFRPHFNAPNQVQFWVFGPDGKRQTYANLDHMGKRPVPLVCTRCHGGSEQNNGDLAQFSRFLPLNPALVKWPDELIAQGIASTLSRAAQEEKVRKLNMIAMKTPLTDVQIEMVKDMYSGKLTTAGTKAREPLIGNWAARGHGLYFQKVITPYCGTCHFAFQTPWTATWESFQTLRRMMRPMVCYDVHAPPPDAGAGGGRPPIMPNAEPTVDLFWSKPIQTPFATMKSWFIQEGNIPDANDVIRDCDGGTQLGQGELHLGCGMEPLDPDPAVCTIDGRTPDNQDYCPPQKLNNARCGEQPGSARTCHGLCNDECISNAHCSAETECLGGKCQPCGRYGRLACTSRTACQAPYAKNGLVCDLASNPLAKQNICRAYVRLHQKACRTSWTAACDKAALSGIWTDPNNAGFPGCWEYAFFAAAP